MYRCLRIGRSLVERKCLISLDGYEPSLPVALCHASLVWAVLKTKMPAITGQNAGPNLQLEPNSTSDMKSLIARFCRCYAQQWGFPQQL